MHPKAKLLSSSILITLLLSQLACTTNKNRLPPEIQAILEKADRIELLSLNPDRPDEEPKDAFHGFRVLGSTTIKGNEQAAALAALSAAIDTNHGMAAACFNPRHGIRAKQGGKSVDLVICFECLQISVYLDDQKLKGVLTTADAQPLFNKILTAANVPLAKTAHQ